MWKKKNNLRKSWVAMAWVSGLPRLGWRENSESDIFGRMELWPLSRMFYSLCLALKFSWQCLLFRTVILQKRSLGLPIHPASCPASFPGFSSVWENTRLRAIKEYRTTGHDNVKCWGKVRWEDWAFLSLPFPPFFARNQNRSIRSRLRISETAPGFGILEQTVSTVKC